MFLLGASTFAMWFFLSLYLQQVRGYSPLRAGLAFLPMTLSIVVASTLVSRGVTRIGAKPLLVVGMTLLALGLVLFTRLSPDGSYVDDVLGPSVLAAVGMGMAFVPVAIAAVSGVAPHEAGLASGLDEHLPPVRRLARARAPRRNRDRSHQQRPSARGRDARRAHQRVCRVAFGIAAAFAAAGAVIAAVGLPRVAVRASRRQAIAAEGA